MRNSSSPSIRSWLTTGIERSNTLSNLLLVGIIVASWWFVAMGAGTGMSTLAMTSWQFPLPELSAMTFGGWSYGYGLTMLIMWWVMMIAMMLPSASPMILLFSRVYRHQCKPASARGHNPALLLFLGGYLLLWLVFSLAAVGLQWFLEMRQLLHPMMMWASSHSLSAALLLFAGIYQLTPLKQRCLHQCQFPAQFLSTHWRPGLTGVFQLGVKHGLYCVACCSPLMLLLFVGGAMNLVWILGLTVWILVEKLVPHPWIRYASGGVLIAAAYLFFAN